jgi:predicted transcriptional regulator of viral defense system
MAVHAMVNEDYEPNENEDRILEFIKDEPCTRVTNRYVREKTGLPAERVDPALNSLRKAGWLRRLTRGFYEYVEDPRDDE